MHVQIIKVQCPICSQVLDVPIEYRGRKGKCFYCNHDFLVPKASQTVATDEHLAYIGDDRTPPEAYLPMDKGMTRGPRFSFNLSDNLVLVIFSAVLPIALVIGGSSIGFAVIWSIVSISILIAHKTVQTRENAPETGNHFNNDGYLFWFCLFVVPPLALVWALLMDDEHPRKKVNIFRAVFYWILIWSAVGFFLLVVVPVL